MCIIASQRCSCIVSIWAIEFCSANIPIKARRCARYFADQLLQASCKADNNTHTRTRIRRLISIVCARSANMHTRRLPGISSTSRLTALLPLVAAPKCRPNVAPRNREPPVSFFTVCCRSVAPVFAKVRSSRSTSSAASAVMLPHGWR
jgi:hypothetical protein